MMPQFSFHTSRKGQVSDAGIPAVFENGEAARQEALAICTDMVRDIVAELTPNSEWRMDVRNEAGETQFCIRIVSEAIRQD
jgi:hypothetical protein